MSAMGLPDGPLTFPNSPVLPQLTQVARSFPFQSEVASVGRGVNVGVTVGGRGVRVGGRGVPVKVLVGVGVSVGVGVGVVVEVKVGVGVPVGVAVAVGVQVGGKVGVLRTVPSGLRAVTWPCP